MKKGVPCASLESSSIEYVSNYLPVLRSLEEKRLCPLRMISKAASAITKFVFSIRPQAT